MPFLIRSTRRGGWLHRINASDYVIQAPEPIGDAGCHGRRFAERFVDSINIFPFLKGRDFQAGS